MSTVDSERDTDGIPERRLEFETMIADISSRFVHLSPDELDLTIEGALRRVCAFLGVELAVLWQWSAADPRVITPTHVHCSPGIPRPSEPMRQEQYPWARQQMLAGRGFALSSLAEYPAEAAVDRETCRSLGIRSGICLPLAMDGEAPVGALGLSSLSAERPWPRALVKRLELVASVLTNALARRRHELSLRESEARLAAGIEIAGLAYFEVDLGARAVFVDDRFRALCGIPADRERELQIVEYWMDHLHLSDAPRVLELRQQVEAGKVEQFHLEYRYLHPVRGEIWLQHIGRAAERDANGLAIRTYGVLRDITERRRAEEELRRSHAEIEQLRDRLQAEADYLKAEIRVIHPYGEITGHSAAIQKVLEQVARVAPTDSSVLVLGETGTGKELVAQAIHRLSPRRSRLMVKVNCAALPSGLVESELFGREKGAYTGALTRQVGRFEVADGSTLFLDEIGELSLELQAKLLRVLEAGEFERLGSSRTLKVDVRVIAASNRDLIQEINKGRFRADLFYRLNVFPIRVPPLRERAEDIAQLVWAFLEEFSARMGKKITQVPRRTMEALQRQPWPGNVRELRNLIEHAAIITDGPILRLPAFDEERSAAAPARTLAEAERGHILKALERAGWHVKGPNGAAVELGLKPATLYSRMKKLGIRPRRQAPDRIA